MKRKPLVCLIDEDPVVGSGWAKALKNDAVLHHYRNHLGLMKTAATSHGLIAKYACIIVGRHFEHLDLDLVESKIPETLRASASGPIFLNWQGFVPKDELVRFDGKLFHKYGVRWQTLRLRILKHAKADPSHDGVHSLVVPTPRRRTRRIAGNLTSRPERCSALLRTMAENASGTHREKIEFYALHDQTNGVRLLEAIYNKLVTDKNRPETCPSKYINSSPVIAKRILYDALFSENLS